MMNRFIATFLILFSLICSCKRVHTLTPDAPTDINSETSSDSDCTVVQTIEAKIQPFKYELVCTGKVEAGKYVDLSFTSTNAIIERIQVHNGQRVSKGQILAELDRFKLENAVKMTRNLLERSQLDLSDALIGQGYDPDNISAIPDDVMRLARLRSGVVQAEVQLVEAERALSDATLKSPFNGTVANLFHKEGNLPDMSQPFCRVIASCDMEVIFPIIESELQTIDLGDSVEVRPYSSKKSYSGRISSINPIVDKDGMVKVCAVVKDGSDLYVGMNVRVVIKRKIEEALVVPKKAVVLRSGGRKVVFTHQDGKAIWNYVTVSLENMDEFVVSEGLEPGQEVIVSGNINLANESSVLVKND